MKERRKLRRFGMRLPAKIVGYDQGVETVELETRDISSDGAFLLTGSPLDAGTKLKLELELPVEKLRQLFDGQRTFNLRIKGVVIRKEASGVAVKFTKKYKIDLSG
jgi:hypothetical protein